MAQEEVLRAYKFALDPNPEQRDQLARSAGASRWAFNWGLNLKVTAHQAWRNRLAELTEDRGLTEDDAKKRIKQETTELRKRIKTLDAHKKDLKAAARAEGAPADIPARFRGPYRPGQSAPR